MLTIDLGTLEYYDGDSNQFVYEEVGEVRFEYSLKMIYEWESKWRKPFLKSDKTDEELLDFYKRMALDPIKDEAFTDEVMERLSAYIGDPDTATTFSSYENGQSEGVIARNKKYTAEELYAMMISNNIPLEFENRNLNRLMTVLKIIAAYNNPPKKMTREEIFKQNRELNRQRREELKSKG